MQEKENRCRERGKGELSREGEGEKIAREKEERWRGRKSRKKRYSIREGGKMVQERDS